MTDPATSPVVFVAAMSVLGLTVGSFLNVVVSRLPRMMERAWRTECREMLEEVPERADERFDLVRPPSACPACGHRLSVRENIPVASWLVLRGRCAACRWRIPVRYPIVELLGALVAGAAAARFGFGAEALAAMALGWGLIAVSAIDVETRLLPDAITLPLLWLGLAVNLTAAFAPLRDCVIGAMAGYLLLWSVHHGFRLLTGREGMGYGDFKLLAALGAWLGWPALPDVVVLASLGGVLVGIVLVASGRASRHTPLPFGPYLAGAGLLVLHGGGGIVTTWLATWSAWAAAWPTWAAGGT